jgi:hypothetical protein
MHTRETRCRFAIVLSLVLCASSAYGQQPAETLMVSDAPYVFAFVGVIAGLPTCNVLGDQASTTAPQDGENKRIWGIIPNYRTSPDLKDYVPLTTKQKFAIAKDDSLDRGTFVLAALFGAEAQFFGSSPSFGHGLSAYARYTAASYADWSIGNVMTEGVFPALLHEDPRYFRRGEGSGWSRLGYAVQQIFWTHTDSGGAHFNFSEVLGNSTAAAISNLYYPDNRTFGSNAVKVGLQIGVDMASNIVKEFSPDLDRALSRKHPSTTP